MESHNVVKVVLKIRFLASMHPIRKGTFAKKAASLSKLKTLSAVAVMLGRGLPSDALLVAPKKSKGH